MKITWVQEFKNHSRIRDDVKISNIPKVGENLSLSGKNYKVLDVEHYVGETRVNFELDESISSKDESQEILISNPIPYRDCNLQVRTFK